MTIYEVRIEVDNEIAQEYRNWLEDHMAEIVKCAGFDKALLLAEKPANEESQLFTVQYWAPDEDTVLHYIENLAPAFRADGVERFGDRFRAQRRILNLHSAAHSLTSQRRSKQIDPTLRKDISMTSQVNWQKIRNEFQRLTDIDELKTEVQRIRKELAKFDFQSVLSPAASAKVKAFEKRYTVLMRTISQAQRQVDREVNRIMRQIKVHRNDVSKVMTEQKSKLESLSTDFRKRFTAKKSAAAKTARTPSRKTTKKATRTAKKRTK